MSRDEGFAIADVSTSHHEDTKVKAMWRGLRPDESAMNAAMTLHEAVRLASWRDGKRLTAAEAAPAWMADVDTPAGSLAAYGLLDDSHRIPLSTWKTWFGTAKRRRDASRKRWSKSKAGRRARVNSEGDSNDGPRGHDVETRAPSVPTVPTVRPSPRAGARRATGQLTRVGEVLGGEHDESVAAGLALLREAGRR